MKHVGPSLEKIPFSLGVWTVRPDLNQVQTRDTTVRLEPKTMEVLVYLAARSGDVVSREELLQSVWPDVVVTEGTLSRCVSQLRKAFGDSARRPEVIETIQKKGYRLLLPVRTAPGGDSLARETDDAEDRRAATFSGPPEMAIPVGREPTSAATGISGERSLAFRAAAAGLLTCILVATFWTFGNRSDRELVGSAPRDLSLPQTLPLTASPGIETSAALSPDGEFVAFIGQRPTSAYPGLYVKKIGTDSALLLSDSARIAQYPAWFPDGHRLAYLSCDLSFTCSLLQTSAFGQDERRLAGDIRQPWGITLSPDGEHIVYSAHDSTSGTWRLHTMALPDGSSGMLLPDSPSTTRRGDLDPTYSPSGEWIVFKRSVSEGVADVFAASSDGLRLRRLTEDAASVAGQTWTPDGRAIIISSSRNGIFQLWRIPLDGSVPTRISEVAARDPGFPVLSSDGRRLVFEEWQINVNLWRVPLSDGVADPERVIDSSGWNRQPAVSPDGDWIAFISARTGAPELWRSRLDGSEALRLSDFKGLSVGAPAWDSDSKRIAFEVFDDGQADIWIADLSGSQPRRFTFDSGNDRSPSFSQHGSTIYYSSDRTGSWQIWGRSSDEAAGRQITTEGGRRALESQDGRVIYVSRFDEAGLWATSLLDGSSRLLTSALGRQDWGNWVVTGDGIVLAVRSNRRASLHSLSPQGGKPMPLGIPLDRLILDDPGLAVAPDGSFVIYAKVERQESDLAYVDGIDLR